MKRELADGCELDDDRDRVDVAAVHRYLSEESYWAKGREYAEVELMVREAARVVGLYNDGKQIGFCRAARCAPELFYLADVYVLDEFRGRGFGAALVGATGLSFVAHNSREGRATLDTPLSFASTRYSQAPCSASNAENKRKRGERASVLVKPARRGLE